MPTFDTRQPIAVHIEIGVGEIRIAAADRTDTVVEVRPADPAKQGDVTAAEQTRVDYSDGVLHIKGPKGWRRYSFRGGAEAIHMEIDLPVGSTVRGEAGVANFQTTGRLGECRFKSGAGDIRIDEAGAVSVKSSAGDITVGRAAGPCEIATASGAVRLGTVDGPLVIKNSNGDSEIGDVTGDLRVSAANGKISVDRAQSTVAVKTANGDIRLGEVVRGAVHAHTAFGRIDVGIRDGVAAWLDLNTAFGKVRSDLDSADRPAPGEDTVELKARTAYGDITIRRAVAQPVGDGRTPEGP
jgi:putative adhesin